MTRSSSRGGGGGSRSVPEHSERRPTSRTLATVDGTLFEGEPLRPLTRDEVARLIDAGCFDKEKLELLFGVVVQVPLPTPEHEEAVYRISTALTLAVDKRAKVRTRLSFSASDVSQPIPDVLVAPPGNYWNEHPSRAHLVVEVSHRHPHRDRVLKQRLYAEAEVEEYWIVDLDRDVVTIHRERIGGRWRSIDQFVHGERIAPLALPDAAIAVDEILPVALR